MKRLALLHRLVTRDGLLPGSDRGRGCSMLAPSGTDAAPAERRPINLLRAAPFDRVTLIDGTVLIVDPVSPRPLPRSTRPRSARSSGVARRTRFRSEGNIIPGVKTKLEMPGQEKEVDAERSAGRRGQAASAARRRQGSCRLQGEADEHQEDRVFRGHAARGVRSPGRAARLHAGVRVLPAGADPQPRLAGLFDRVNRVLFAEGSKALIDGDGERGLRLLRELLGRKRDYPGLLDQIGEAYSKRIERASSLGPLPAWPAGPARARGARARAHPGEADARAVHQQGDGSRQGVGVGAARRAARRADRGAAHLAELEGIEPLYKKAFSEEPTLEVAVNDVASPLGPWVRTPADAADQPAALSPDPGQRRRRRPPGQEARPARRGDRVVRPGPSPGASRSGRAFTGPTARGRSRRSTWGAT